MGSLINNQSLWPKGVPGELNDTYFEYKEVGYTLMIEERTQDNKLFIILCMKDSYYVMNIMASWMKLDELEGT